MFIQFIRKFKLEQKELVEVLRSEITDMLGRDVNGDEKDVMLLYIYDDGSIERVYIKEQL